MNLKEKFYNLIYENTGLKRNNLSESCAQLTEDYSDEFSIDFALYVLSHKHSLLSIKEQLTQFKKEQNDTRN
jgi:hypothetical protein